MKLCIPSTGEGGLDAAVSPHFGRAQTYTLYDTETETIDVVANDGQHHGGGRHPQDNNADTGPGDMVCWTLGWKGFWRFYYHWIDVFCYASGCAQSAREAWEADALNPASADNACSGHHGDGHGHGHGHDHD